MNSNRIDRVLCEQHPDEDYIVDYSSGDTICPKCGLVLIERLCSDEPEWRVFEEDAGRCEKRRTNVSLNWFVSSCQPGIDIRRNNTARRLRKIEQLINNVVEKFNLEEKMGTQIKSIYKKYKDCIKTNANVHCILCACVYYVLTENGHVANFKDLFTYFNFDYVNSRVTRARVLKICRALETQESEQLEQELELTKDHVYREYLENLFNRLISQKKIDKTFESQRGQLCAKFFQIYKRISTETNINPKLPVPTFSVMAIYSTLKNQIANQFFLKNLCDMADIKVSAITYWLPELDSIIN